jgi:tetratricopeptide (TPR) repeat protein
MITDTKKQVLEIFAQGRRMYKLMEFEQALKCFEDALEMDPEDGPSKVYHARCRHYIENPPSEDWDGVFVMTSK